jgi:tRNA(adenine34) deaminase
MNEYKSRDHESFMRRCIELARIAAKQGDAPCGSVVVQNGIIIGEGVESGRLRGDVTFHAEIEAVRRAREASGTGDLSDCALYTTHEPCLMCAYVIRAARIATVVYGVGVGELGSVHSQFPVLRTEEIIAWGAPPVIYSGILEEECRSLRITQNSTV